MGFRKEVTAYKLKFEKYDGFEVVVRSLSVGELMDLSSLAAPVDVEDVAQSLDQSNKMLSVFASHLIGWNLEDENGKPVPANMKGIKSQEMPFILEIILEWMNKVASVDENLGKKQNTLQSLGSLPMETLS